MKNMLLEDRLYNFALRIIKLVMKLPRNFICQELGRQILKSGTSISANYEEARGAFSKEDFIYKINISFKESRETYLWLNLLKDSGIIDSKKMGDIIQESEEIRNILGTSIKTAKRKKKE